MRCGAYVMLCDFAFNHFHCCFEDLCYSHNQIYPKPFSNCFGHLLLHRNALRKPLKEPLKIHVVILKALTMVHS